MTALRSLLAFAVLALWLSPAGAFCVSEAAYEYVMRDDSPAPTQSLPCCGASTARFAVVDKDRPIEGRTAAPDSPGLPAYASEIAAANTPAASPLRWRSYCERSARLLR